MNKMVEIVVKDIDAQGRVTIPMSWRKKWKSRKLALILREDRIEVAPIERILPSDLFDSVKIQGDVDFTDPHSLKKALLELRES